MTKILIADDDLELQDLLKFSFETAGYEVFQAYDGKEALIKIKKVLPDIIILDVLMPGMNGFEVTNELKNDPETCLIPIIMLTSLSHTKDRLTGLKLGADEYLVKSIEPYELIARAENLLKKYYDNVNMLTRLPGENFFEKQINALLNSATEEFYVVYLDICDFKPYNLKYGFEEGDNLLKLFSGILRSAVANLGTSKDSICHIYASRFAFISFIDEQRLNMMLENIILLFKDLIRKIFDKETIENGYFIYKLSDGKEVKSNLLNLAVVVVKIPKKKFSHYGELLNYIGEMLSLAKQKCEQTNSNIVVWG